MIHTLPLIGAPPGEALLLLVAALVLDLLAGLVPGLGARLGQGGRAFAAAGRFLERRLNRENRSEANLIVRGAVAMVVVGAAAAALGLAIAVLDRTVPFGQLIELAVLVAFLSGREVVSSLRLAAGFTGGADLAQARAHVAALTGRDAATLDAHGIARAEIAAGAQGLATGIVAPALWYVVAGLAGLLAWCAVAELARRFALAGRNGDGFALAAVRLAHALGLLPAALAAAFLTLAALVVPGASMAAALALLRAESKGEATWPVAATAGALGLALGGPDRGGWIGDGRARAGQGDVRRALFLVVVAALITAVAVAGLTLLRLR